MATVKFQTVSEYIKTLPKEVQPILQSVKETIRKAAPGVKEKISYNIPAFNLNGRYVVYFAAWKNHISLYPVPRGTDSFNKEIAVYQTGKGTIQFPLDQPIPLSLVTQIVKYRIREFQEKDKKSKNLKSSTKKSIK